MTGPDRSILLAGDDHLSGRTQPRSPMLCNDSRPQFGALDAVLVQQVVRDTRPRTDGHPTREFVPILSRRLDPSLVRFKRREQD
jgi:hypothetical protein